MNNRNEGIIYVMTSVVEGLIKIGKCETNKFKDRMRDLEKNGYHNITGLNRFFAIRVNDYGDKEKMLHKIFDKSRVPESELFALDENLVIQLLSSFDGEVIFPFKGEKDKIFEDATEEIAEEDSVPDGTYFFKKKKKSDSYKTVSATAIVKKGHWTIKKGSVLGVSEDKGVSQKARDARLKMRLDAHGKLLEDYELGKCLPSRAGVVVMNGSIDGWVDWKDQHQNPIDVYRKKGKEVSDDE